MIDPKVSVIMTVYNSDEYLNEAIQSILNQTLSNFEFVIVDDGSTDNTPAILNDASIDNRIKLITSERVGRGKALNIAWRNSTGEYIANIDADDISLPERLDRQLKYFHNNKKLGLLGTVCKEQRGNTVTKDSRDRALSSSELKRLLVKHNPFVHSSVMIPRIVLEKVGGYSEALPVTIDYDLWVKIAKYYEIENLASALTVKRITKTAYFRNRIPNWVRYKAHVNIRWRAWKNIQGHMLDLRFVIIPAIKYIFYRSISLIKL